MKKNKTIILLFFTLFIVYSKIFNAQNGFNTWYFGNNAGLDFSDGYPIAVPDNKSDNQWEAVVSISHPVSGQLQFYSNGISVWDRNHNIMPNGMDLAGSHSSTMILAIPFINNPNKYYLFTTSSFGGPLKYSVIDMYLNEGLGDIKVLEKNMLLCSNCAEKVDATINNDSTGYWLLSHHKVGNAFLAYPVDEHGIGNPVVSNIGTPFQAGSDNSIGYMKFSNAGNIIANTIYDMNNFKPFEIFDFNKSTGTVSNPQILCEENLLYGVEFSPDDSKLYVTKNRGFTDQFDLSAGNLIDIINSRTRLNHNSGAAQLGVDGKIYIANDGSNYLDVIHSPNEAGWDCFPDIDVIDLGDGICRLGLPSYVPAIISTTITATKENEGNSSQILIFPNPARNYINIQLKNIDAYISTAEILDSTGKRVLVLDERSDNFMIDTSKCQAGLYYVKVVSDSAISFERFIKS